MADQKEDEVVTPESLPEDQTPRGFTCAYARVREATRGGFGKKDQPRRIRVGVWMPTTDPIERAFGYAELPTNPGELFEDWRLFRTTGNKDEFLILEDASKTELEGTIVGGSVHEVTIVNEHTGRHRAGRINCSYNIPGLEGDAGVFYALNDTKYTEQQDGDYGIVIEDDLIRVRALLSPRFHILEKFCFAKTPDNIWRTVTGFDVDSRPEHPWIPSRKVTMVHTLMVPPASLPKGATELVFKLRYRYQALP